MIDEALRSPAAFRAALRAVRRDERERWIDELLGLDELPEDGPDLPRGCTPYLPCSVSTLIEVAEEAALTADDVVVDLGSGLGRALALLHLLSGAEAVGIEIQRGLVERARALTEVWRLPRVRTVHGDAARLAGREVAGSVFLLYSPFGGDRVEAVVDGLEALSRARPLRLCFVDVPPPARPWLVAQRAPAGRVAGGLVVCRTTLHEGQREVRA